MPWEKKKMLVWCQTYPALSTRYVETVCTGAIELGTSGLMRLYPLVLRGLDQDAAHNKWSVIEANVKRTTRDSRPESWRIDNSSITFIDRYEDTADARRVTDLYKEEHVFEGLEHLMREQVQNKTSMGLVDAELVSARVERISEKEQAQWQEKFKEVTANRDLWSPDITPIPCAKLRPLLTFRCAGDSQAYERTGMGWEIYALANKILRPHPDASIEELSALFEAGLRRNCFRDIHDTKLALGNIQRFPSQFSIISVLYPRSKRFDPTAQQSLF